jgi:hypothetical protein
MIPGATQGMINLALLGPGKMREYLELQRQLGATTKESAAEAQAYQRALANLDSTASNLGRTIVTKLAPALTASLDAMRKFINGPDQETRDKTTKVLGIDDSKDSFWEQTFSKVLGVPTKRGNQYRMGDMYGRPTGVATPPTPPESATTTTPAGAGASRSTVPGGAPSASEMEAFIRAEAIARGIDPSSAVASRRARGSSPISIRRAGRASSRASSRSDRSSLTTGANGKSLGDKFTSQTGLDARDPSTWQGRSRSRSTRRSAAAGGRGTGGRATGGPESGRAAAAGGGRRSTSGP